ncbi:hypothetical protein LTR08_008109 [Meristemomyces frigidus]|nr:hypothetical protein LTR08_008109 [Meristemomyces frigidus]
MRLLNTRTLRFESFADYGRPPFAILSHRWGKGKRDEVTFRDMRTYQQGLPVLKEAGYAKVKGFCRLARSLRYDYAWMDTCCVDQSSLSELSELITSMFIWYTEAAICVAYLWDVGDTVNGLALEKSEWFDRVWTLQELIAPREVLFYNRHWTHIGSKTKRIAGLSRTTTIPEIVLSDASTLKNYSVAQRMSWAAHRRTERVEDIAYSLMGLFGVSIPIQYGDREKAFLKLQQAIIESSDDESIFSWLLDDTSHPHGYSGLFAPSPRYFSGCANVEKAAGSCGFRMTNTGLSLSLETIPYCPNTYYAILNCTHVGKSNQVYAIFIAKLPTKGQYARVTSSRGESRILMPRPLIAKTMGRIKRDIRIRQEPREAPL